jgi:CDP-diacylglycerol--glycerol-3-phosphate 3-phosphatidyltransferase
MKHGFKTQVRGGLDPLVTFLMSLRVHPNVLTLVGVALGVVAGVVVAQGRVREGAIWLLVSGLFDMLDGQVARRSGQASTRGAFFDSTLDRYAEGAFFIGLMWHFASAGDVVSMLAAVLVLVGSLLVSYARARAEGLGTECRVGLMERPERFVLTIIGCLAGGVVLTAVLWIMVALVHATAVHRIVHVYRKLGA